MMKYLIAHKHTLAGILLVIAVGLGIYSYLKHAEYYPTTDDAYVGASIVNVASKTSGYITTLAVKNNQLVHRGELLFKIDPTDYNFSLQQAQLNYASAQAQVAITQQQLTSLHQNILKEQRRHVSPAVITQDNNQLLQLQNRLKLHQSQQASLKNTQALAQAQLNFTAYYAPVTGMIANLNNLTAGEYITVGQHLFGLVAADSWWVDANFKETQISRVAQGQKVKVKLDLYPHIYDGIVQSISYASGDTFALLPAQNATGNWVKVTQRFSVRILLKNDPHYPLRVGASASVKIATLD